MSSPQARPGDSSPQPQHHPSHAAEQRVRKRRRRTMACTQCRSRKIRCDREYPICGRCQKSKTPANCTYEDGYVWQMPNTVSVSSSALPDRGSTGPNTPPDSALTNHHQQRPRQPLPTTAAVAGSIGGEKRDCFLETVLGAPKSVDRGQGSGVNSDLRQRVGTGGRSGNVGSIDDDGDGDDGLRASPSRQLDLSPKILMRGKETKTRFNGSGIFANLMAQFPHIKSFTEEIRLSYPNLARFQPELERVKRGLWKQKPLSDQIPVPDARTLILLLPPRRVVDELVGLYLTYIESTHRILHIPSFLRDLDHFWDQRQTPELVSPAFVAQLLLVLSCSWTLADFGSLQSLTDVPLNCYTGVEWSMYAEKWIENAYIKRPEITAFRLFILSIITQNCYGMNRSKAWLATGTLIKQAMLSGYHRDPSRYGKISIFNKEMRRRIWMSMVELDLQVAIDRGMPPSVQPSDYDTAPPLNVNDDELHEGITELPAERPLNELTSSSFQVVMSKSLPLRLRACNLMHSPRISCRYEDIARMDWELNKHLSAIPAWTSETEDVRIHGKIRLVRALLETKLSQTLLCIHTPFAVEAEREPLFTPSARARLEVAITMVSTQKQLHETSSQLSLAHMCDWTLQACCSVCQLLHSRDNLRSSTLLANTLPEFPEYLLSLVETILGCIETRLHIVAKGAKEYFFMSTIIALVKTKLWPAHAQVYKQEVVDRILSFAQTLFMKHASCNHLGDQGIGNFASQAPPTGAGFTPLAVGLDGMMQPAAFGITPPGEFDPFMDVFDWDDFTSFDLGT